RFFFQAEDGIRDLIVTGVQTCALPIFASVTVPIASFTEFTAYTVTGLPGYTDVGGSFVFGSAAAVVAAGSGEYSFVLAATRLLQIGRASCRERVYGSAAAEAVHGEGLS